jgi:hypothetical protein
MKKQKSAQERVSRRNFLKATSTAVVAGAVFHSLSLENSADAASSNFSSDFSQSRSQPASQRLLTGWDYHRGSLGGPWEVWRKANDDANTCLVPLLLKQQELKA